MATGMMTRALSDEVGTGSAQESASQQDLRAMIDCKAIRHGSKGMTVIDHIVTWSMMSGLALAVRQRAQTTALPAQFV